MQGLPTEGMRRFPAAAKLEDAGVDSRKLGFGFSLMRQSKLRREERRRGAAWFDSQREILFEWFRSPISGRRNHPALLFVFLSGEITNIPLLSYYID